MTSGTDTYSTTLDFPSYSGYNALVQIVTIKTSPSCGGCTVGYTAGFNPAKTAIVIGYNDTATTTTAATDALILTNASGTYTLYANAHDYPLGAFQDSYSCASDACNVTMTGELSVKITYTVAGMVNTASIPIAAGSGQIFPMPDVPSAILGIGSVFGPVTPVSLFAYFVILLAAGIFGAYSAKFGGIVIAALAAVFAASGWLPMLPGASIFIVALAVTSYMAFLRQGR